MSRYDLTGVSTQILFYEDVPRRVQQDNLIDAIINCMDCRRDFVWTSGEQLFFRDKGLHNPPKRCKACKNEKNKRIAAVAAAQTTGLKIKIEVSVKCADCNVLTTVPFYPSQGRPVYCRSCFLERNSENQS